MSHKEPILGQGLVKELGKAFKLLPTHLDRHYADKVELAGGKALLHQRNTAGPTYWVSTKHHRCVQTYSEGKSLVLMGLALGFALAI